MDVIYDNDRKLGVFEESDMAEYFDQDMFPTTSMNMEPMEGGDQWFDSLFHLDTTTFSDKVLNDRSLTDAAQPPCIKSEHSYSLNDHPSSPLGLTKLDDFETDLFKDMALDLTSKTGAVCSHAALKQESMEFDLSLLPTPASSSSSSTSTAPGCPAPSPHPASLLLTASALERGMDVSPGVAAIVVKQEPPDTFDQSSSDQTVNVDCISMDMPPTPPSSGSSDSDGSLSPTRSAPSSPIRSSSSRQHSSTTTTYSQLSSKSLAPHSLFLSPIPQSGTLQLTEEEKRTLVSEGYSIPAKLPLTKQEEKNLKKIRRKIKNKISAQESRRKKKEYLEALEKKCEAFTHENTDLRKKVDTLENSNRTLLSQLQKLQDFVSKMPRAAATATQTSTVVMVLVLSFAVFLGSWGSASFNIGYSSGGQALGPLFSPQPNIIHPAPSIGPKVGQASVGEEDYSTPNLKSRVLLSVREEGEELEGDDFWPQVPWSRASVCDAAAAVHPGAASSQPQHPQAAGPGPSTHSPPGPEPSHPRHPPSLPVVTMVMTATGSNNESQAEFQATMHPDIAAAVPTPDARGNLTAELETA